MTELRQQAAGKIDGAKNQVLLSVLCVLLSLLLAFGIVEVALRLYAPQEVAPIRFVFDPQLGEIPTPNQRGRKIRPGYFDHTYSHNSLGLRGSREYLFDRQTAPRVLFLGDSFTYGFGVNDDQTFAFLAEKHLLERHFSVEAINAGNSGKGTDYELKFFQVLGHKFHPVLTVLCFTANDFIDNERGEYYAVASDGEITPKTLKASRGLIKNIFYYLPGYNWLISWSHAANLVKQATVHWLLKTTDPTRLKEAPLVVSYPTYQSGYAREANKQITEIYLKNMSKSVKAAGSSFVICYISMSNEVEKYRREHAFSNDELAIRAMAQRQGIPVISLTPMLAASQVPLEKLYFHDDGHWTAAGHALVGQYLSEQLGALLQNR